jgi:hypothetical protein
MKADSIEAVVTKNAARVDQVRLILLVAYQFKGSKESEAAQANPDDAAKLFAADCGTRLFNVLYSARNPGAGVGYTALMDLMVHLNGNPFWAKHGPVLMPLLHSAMAAQADYATLLLEKGDNPNITKDDEVRAECKLVGLELFVMIAFLLSGPELSTFVSLSLKRQLAPLLG